MATYLVKFSKKPNGGVFSVVVRNHGGMICIPDSSMLMEIEHGSETRCFDYELVAAT
jgi:hypothetical protein